MITEVEIVDNTNTPLNYLSDLKSFKNGTRYVFKPGINIIIGKNGCGKSSLLKVISKFMLCNNSIVSKAPDKDNILDIMDLFNDSLYDEASNKTSPSLKDGIKVKSEYSGVTYRYLPQSEMNRSSILESAFNAFTYMDNASRSTGEKMMNSLNSLFEYAFSNNSIEFPIRKLASLRNESNDLWKGRLDRLLSYYKDNRIKIDQSEFQYTFLIDEPDRNLDIENIGMIYDILSYKKEYTQLICVIHNPILIYKLSKLDYINFVEMSPRYLDKIKEVFKNL